MQRSDLALLRAFLEGWRPQLGQEKWTLKKIRGLRVDAHFEATGRARSSCSESWSQRDFFISDASPKSALEVDELPKELILLWPNTGRGADLPTLIFHHPLSPPHCQGSEHQNLPSPPPAPLYVPDIARCHPQRVRDQPYSTRTAKSDLRKAVPSSLADPTLGSPPSPVHSSSETSHPSLGLRTSLIGPTYRSNAGTQQRSCFHPRKPTGLM